MALLADDSYYTNDRGQLVHVMHDPDCESPRAWEYRMGTFYTWSGSYASPDGGRPGDVSELGARFGLEVADSPVEFCEAFSRDVGVAIPVWAHAHGDVAYRAATANPFADPWDSALAGVIFATDERIRELRCVGEVTREVREEAMRELADEVDEYSQWANGDAFGYVAYDAAGNEVDSCWGFVGDDGGRSGLEDAAGTLAEADVRSVDEWVANGGRTYGLAAAIPRPAHPVSTPSLSRARDGRQMAPVA